MAPNVEVSVKQGKTAVFKGITDGSGRFTTTLLEPGVYRFELRALKTAPPAQYFLLLSGAKPVSGAMFDKKTVLTMDAQVRAAKSVTGQVTARRMMISKPQAATATAAGNTMAPAAPRVTTTQPTTSRLPNAPGQNAIAAQPSGPTTESFVRRPSGYHARMINGQPHEWVPISSGSDLGRWMPVRGGYLRTQRATAGPVPATAQPSPTPKPSPARR